MRFFLIGALQTVAIDALPHRGYLFVAKTSRLQFSRPVERIPTYFLQTGSAYGTYVSENFEMKWCLNTLIITRTSTSKMYNKNG
jgi:hypothetical protein